MSQQAKTLRQPKILNLTKPEPRKSPILKSKVQYVIITLKGDKKLVLPTDAYHGILMTGDEYKCIFCKIQLSLNHELKEDHKNSSAHLEFIKNYPHIEEFSEHLLRQISPDKMYCTICSVELSANFVSRHITSEMHSNELQRAITRASIYKPCLNTNAI